MNYGMDSYLFGVDMERQTKIAKVITDFFEKDGYRHGHFNWDGTNGYGDFTIGQAGANAVATYALLEEDGYKDLVKKVLQKAWDSKPIVGSQLYTCCCTGWCGTRVPTCRGAGHSGSYSKRSCRIAYSQWCSC